MISIQRLRSCYISSSTIMEHLTHIYISVPGQPFAEMNSKTTPRPLRRPVITAQIYQENERISSRLSLLRMEKSLKSGDSSTSKHSSRNIGNTLKLHISITRNKRKTIPQALTYKERKENHTGEKKFPLEGQKAFQRPPLSPHHPAQECYARR